MIQKKSKLIGNKEKECNDVTLLYIKDKNYQIEEYPLRENEDVIYSKALSKIKTIIIPGKYYYYLYSYDLGMIISSSYDYIKYDEEKDIFHVENYINTKYGEITLFGTLTRDGFLIDETLYAPEINKAYCVDSFNLRKYYEQIKKDVEKRLKIKERQKLYKTCEEELTLKRKLH